MKKSNPLTKTREEYKNIIDRITSSDSPVGIDAVYTHAILIEYLLRIDQRLEKLEEMMELKQGND